MKEFIEKLIDRLEEQKSDLTTWAEDKAFEIGIETAVSIVKQLAEEFATDKNVGHNDQDLMIVESLPSLYPMMQPFEEEAVYRVVERAKYNYAWILCSERLPEVFDNVLICTKEGGRAIGHRCPNQKTGRYYDLHGSAIDSVIAWQPLPEPFKLKD